MYLFQLIPRQKPSLKRRPNFAHGMGIIAGFNSSHGKTFTETEPKYPNFWQGVTFQLIPRQNIH